MLYSIVNINRTIKTEARQLTDYKVFFLTQSTFENEEIGNVHKLSGSYITPEKETKIKIRL